MITNPKPNLETLLWVGHMLREMWRLRNQHLDFTKGKASLLPPHLLATFAGVRDRLNMLRDQGEALGGWKPFLQKQREHLEQHYGQLTDWVAPECVDFPDRSWQVLFDKVLEGVEKTRELACEPALTEAEVVAIDWEISARALHNIHFAARAADGLKNVQDVDGIMADARVKRAMVKNSNILEMQILSAEGRILGGGCTVDAAIEQARRAELASKPYKELTFQQFVDITTVIEVQDGRGKTGTATKGKVRLLFPDITSMATMRAFCGQWYDALTRQGKELQPRDRKQWIEDGLKELMSQPLQTSMKSMAIDGVGHLLMHYSNFPISRMQMLESIYASLNAPEETESGPKASAPQRMKAA